MYTTELLFSYLDDIAVAIKENRMEDALQLQSYIYEMLDDANITFSS